MAKFDDLLTISTELISKTRVRLKLNQDIYRDNDLIFKAVLDIVSIDMSGVLVKLPKVIFDKFT